ncbi:hypothetical protein X971_2846 [Agrobacterium tumefaciens LBA4213 (Ach5)]|nr:hypothetical protein X971_2846 [Agrobacterium tumefaciens LBA4213 (Ach5)]
MSYRRKNKDADHTTIRDHRFYVAMATLVRGLRATRTTVSDISLPD